MTNFWELVERSVIIQGIITLCLIGTVIYLTVSQVEVPKLIEALTLLVVGFYFGSKVENATTRKVVDKLTNGS